MEHTQINNDKSPRKFFELVIRQVPMQFNNEKLNHEIKQHHKNVISVRRILAYPNRTPTKFIRVRILDQISYKFMLDNGCKINGQIFQTELLKKDRHVVSRCYKCHEIGLGVHHAKNCPNETRCLICAQNHHQSECKSETECCANCGMSHRANSVECPVWKKHSRIGKMENDNSTKYDIICLLDNQDRNHAETTQMLTTVLNHQQKELTDIRKLLLKMTKSSSIGPTRSEESECTEPNFENNNIGKLLKSYTDNPSADTSSTPWDTFENIKLSDFDNSGLDDLVKIKSRNKLMYRFQKGCKTIRVLHPRSRTVKIEKPCSLLPSDVKTLVSDSVSCCSFHLLSTINKEYINKLRTENKIQDSNRSLYSWRTFPLK